MIPIGLTCPSCKYPITAPSGRSTGMHCPRCNTWLDIDPLCNGGSCLACHKTYTASSQSTSQSTSQLNNQVTQVTSQPRSCVEVHPKPDCASDSEPSSQCVQTGNNSQTNVVQRNSGNCTKSASSVGALLGLWKGFVEKLFPVR